MMTQEICNSDERASEYETHLTIAAPEPYQVESLHE
jgi:hypothetical protein